MIWFDDRGRLSYNGWQLCHGAVLIVWHVNDYETRSYLSTKEGVHISKLVNGDLTCMHCAKLIPGHDNTYIRNLYMWGPEWYPIWVICGLDRGQFLPNMWMGPLHALMVFVTYSSRWRKVILDLCCTVFKLITPSREIRADNLKP